MIRRSPVSVTFDERPVEKRVGLVLLSTDHTSETDFARMVAGPGVGVYATRIPYANPVTPQNLAAMAPLLRDAAAMILPDEPLDAVCFSCTSASVVIGDAAIEEAVQAAKPGAAVVTPPLAAVAALEALGARRISILTPYTEETSAPMADYFEGKGFTLDRVTCLGLEDDREMARLAPAAIVEAAVEATDRQSDALFISCTALRSALGAAEIEARIARPVVTSNQASAWATLRACGVIPARPEWGRLMAGAA